MHRWLLHRFTMEVPKRCLVKCLYHYPCPDGATAALAAYLHYCKKRATPVEFIPHATYDPINVADLRLQGDETIYLLDYTGPPGFVYDIANRVKSCIVLDHHKTAVEYYTREDQHDMPGNLQLHFDLQRSGATIARDYFLNLKELTPNQNLLFKYIEDADLWRWQMPRSKAFTSGLIARRLEYDATCNPEIFSYLETLDPEQVIKEGEVVLKTEAGEIARILSDAFVIQLGGQHPVGDGQIPSSTTCSSCWGRALGVRLRSEQSALRSQIGNELALRSLARGLLGIGVVIYREPRMLESQGSHECAKVKVSLRSIQGGPDTTNISRYFGGGGHHNASSFLLDENEIQKWILPPESSLILP